MVKPEFDLIEYNREDIQDFGTHARFCSLQRFYSLLFRICIQDRVPSR